MKKMMLAATALGLLHAPTSADTNALIEVKLFKDWIIKGEANFGNFNLAIKNTGSAPIRLFKNPVDFEGGQLLTRPLPRDTYTGWRQEEMYQIMIQGDGEFFSLQPEETHVYEGRKFLLNNLFSFSEEIRFTVSIYLGNGFWLDSEPLIINGVTPDSVEHIATINDNMRNVNDLRKLTLVSCKNERWLYSTLPPPSSSKSDSTPFSICPLSLTNKIRVEPHDGKGLFQVWDGDKSMIFDMYKVMLLEGPDENNVYGKWTRERKQRAEADNAEVRRKKAEEGK